MDICPSNQCVGCGLCAYECPTNSICMITNDEGFLEPVVAEDTCVMCNKCQKNCPSLNLYKKINRTEYKAQYYLAWHISDDIRYKSSSGAAFTALSEFIIREGGVVVGAKYDEDFAVVHGAIDSLEDLGLIRKSKYLQSNIINIYQIIRDVLNKNKRVLFSGTPCQCAAVEKEFGNNELFYSCDVICHGVQSPRIFTDALNYMENKVNGKCISVDFRSKSKGWANACTTEVVFDNGKKINKRANDIPIGAAFLKNLSIRKSCENCKYRTLERASDITIGDFWAIRDEPAYLRKYKDLGFSSIIVNSPKGRYMLDNAKNDLHIEERTVEQVKYQNNPLYKQFTPNPDRDAFFADYSKNGFDYVWEKYLKPKKSSIIKWRVLSFSRKIGILKVYQKIRGVS